MQDGASLQSARTAARNALIMRAHQLGLPLNAADICRHFHFSMWSCDTMCCPCEGVSQHSQRFKVVRVALTGIRSRSSQHPNKLLGSVVYADTFLEVGLLTGVILCAESLTGAGLTSHASVQLVNCSVCFCLPFEVLYIACLSLPPHTTLQSC